MIQAAVTVKDIEGFDAQLEEVFVSIESNLEEIASVVQTGAKNTTLFKDKTGTLRKSIGMRKSKFEDGGYIVVATAPHAWLVEYGHVDQRTGERVDPRKYMRTALEKGITHAIATLRGEI